MSNLQIRIKELRKHNGLTQFEMAKLLREKYGLRTDRVMISKWETGFQVPEIYTISCIADLFQVSIDYLNGTANTKLEISEMSAQEILDYAEKQSETTYDILGYDGKKRTRTKLTKEEYDKMIGILELLRKDN